MFKLLLIKLKNNYFIFFTICFSIFLFLYTFGGKILNPTYVDWLINNGGDSFAQYIGWIFYRNESFVFPLGKIVSYLYPNGTSIVYSDSIPLLAIPLKLFSPYLNSSFQYMGIWIISCFILQAIFAWVLVSTITKSPLLRTLSTLFFIISPIMIYRVGQNSLVTQWLILLSLYLYFQKPTFKIFSFFGLVLILTTTIQLYLTAMVGMVWLAYVIKVGVFYSNDYKFRNLLFTMLVTPGLMLFVMWVVGYFVIPIHDSTSGGWTSASMNLASLFFPIYTAIAKQSLWSPFMVTHSAQPYQYEGANYLGFGILFLGVMGSYELIKSGVNKKTIIINLPLLLISLLLTFWATSTKVYFASHLIINLSTPHFIGFLVNTFRSSGRLFFPVYYLIMYAIIFTIIRRNTVFKSSFILIIAFLLQCMDIHPLIVSRQVIYKKNYVWNGGNLKSQFWNKLKNISMITVFPPIYDADLAYFAATHDIKINAGYVSRYANEVGSEFYNSQLNDFKSGKLSENTLYVINDSSILSKITADQKKSVCEGKLDEYNLVLSTCNNEQRKFFVSH